ncbi:dTDP-4-dehydrorhamnose 3,5-epimerase family protein [Aminobacter anthyllidis]|uniref:dTDP-4-dehydrorhamnose 3,5-epimerase n=1 Tax=Aminobacter anthyllidis TaxID=1035067 RepID=A0A9X1AHC8_9HYPH|nr:dTDP-4-dehydrorhamnose 3,5-epimerase family protein [Aminobacter anthyllidis]
MDMLSLEDFVDDKPWGDDVPFLEDVRVADQIEGVRLQRLATRADKRGDLTVLLSALKEPIMSPPHVYLVSAEPRSIRAWVYHKRQSDRLAYTNGDVRVVLYDLRTDSPTYQKLNILDVGAANKVLLTIPPFVVHGVQNRGMAAATFVNMPTNVYDPENPDKSRVRYDHPGIPYKFD